MDYLICVRDYNMSSCYDEDFEVTVSATITVKILVEETCDRRAEIKAKLKLIKMMEKIPNSVVKHTDIVKCVEL